MYLLYNDITLNGYDERKYHNKCEIPGRYQSMNYTCYILLLAWQNSSLFDLKSDTFRELFWFHHNKNEEI